MSLYHISWKKIILLNIFLVFSVFLLPGCKKEKTEDPISATDFKLNTVVTVKIYDSQDNSLLTECMNLCDKYENIFSRTKTDSELYKLNHRQIPAENTENNTYKVSGDLASLISTGLKYSSLSDGAFDISIEPLTSLWDFTAENPQVPDDALIRQALPECDFRNISVDGTDVTLKSTGTTIELGAVAKGYIADKMKEYLVSQGVKSAIIDLGGNVLCIGKKPDGTSFKVGIQKPFADRNETIATMDIDGKSVVSSGIYERCFKQDGVLYHHILNPHTGYPYDNGLIAVTIISDRSTDGDALSTACFSMGLEKGMELAQSIENVQAFFVTDDYKIHYTKDFQKEIHVTESVS